MNMDTGKSIQEECIRSKGILYGTLLLLVAVLYIVNPENVSAATLPDLTVICNNNVNRSGSSRTGAIQGWKNITPSDDIGNNYTEPRFDVPGTISMTAGAFTHATNANNDYYLDIYVESGRGVVFASTTAYFRITSSEGSSATTKTSPVNFSLALNASQQSECRVYGWHIRLSGQAFQEYAGDIGGAEKYVFIRNISYTQAAGGQSVSSGSVADYFTYVDGLAIRAGASPTSTILRGNPDIGALYTNMSYSVPDYVHALLSLTSAANGTACFYLDFAIVCADGTVLATKSVITNTVINRKTNSSVPGSTYGSYLSCDVTFAPSLTQAQKDKARTGGWRIRITGQVYEAGVAGCGAKSISLSAIKYITAPAAAFTVTLNQQSGSGGTGSVTATYGSAMPGIVSPSRTGYTFGGYYTGTGGGGTQYYTATGASARNWDMTSSTTLYAKWTVNSYSVRCIDRIENTTTNIADRGTKSFNYGTSQSGISWGTDATPGKYNRGYKYVGASSITVPANNNGVVYRYFRWITPTYAIQPENKTTDWAVGTTFTAKVSNVTKTRWQKAHANADGSCKGDWTNISGTEKTWSFASVNNVTTYTVTADDAKNKYMYYRVKAIGDVDE